MIVRSIACAVAALTLSAAFPTKIPAAETVLLRTVDLSRGESVLAELSDGSSAEVKLLGVEEHKGDVWGEIQRAEVTVEVNGEKGTLGAGMYRLPVKLGGVQIDCPVTGGYRKNSHIDHWALEKDARLRLWPAESAWLAPGTFGYPVRQQWFASQTSFSNEPVAPRPRRLLYYHAGLDIGGAEGMVDILSATDALVVSLGQAVLEGHDDDTPIQPRYDVIYLQDGRGWYYRYSHLQSFDPAVKLGERVKLGQKIGALGKEGGSGGWTHLHFEIKSRMPSGRWGTQEGYAFLWESYLRRHHPKVIAVGRPGHVIFAGQTVTHDASRSWSAGGGDLQFEWRFSDGGRSGRQRVRREYEKPGTYMETLKVTDSRGNIDYDFVRVKVFDRRHPDEQPPRLHAAFSPTFDIKPRQAITFKVRAFHTTHGEEIWNFGDGSPLVRTRSDGNVEQRAKDGYAIVQHAFEKPGDYVIHVRRVNEKGQPAEDRLHVRVRR